MQLPKSYFHDKIVLALLSCLAFLLIATVISIVVRVATGDGTDYFVEYRSNVGISAFRTSGLADMLTFIWFSVFVALATVVLSIRTYHIKKQLAHVILLFGTLLVLLALIVSNSLLALR